MVGAMVAVAIGSYLLGFMVRWALLYLNIVDHPNARSNHTQATIRGGGISILVAWIGAVSIHGLSPQVIVWLLAVVVLAIVSFVDDWRPLPAWIRFAHHAVVAIVIVAVLCHSMFQMVGPFHLVVLGITWLGVVGYTNAFNFMDGINGLAATQAVVTGIGMALLAGTTTGQWNAPPVICSLLIAGAALGFLPHNFPRAHMFMGDVGSASIGFILATLILWLTRDFGWRLLPALILIHANFIIDTGFTLIRRLVRGEAWYEAHREHFYQRLIRSGKTHAFVTCWEMGLQVAVLGILLLSLKVGPLSQCALMMMVIMIWIVFYAWADASFKRRIIKTISPVSG